MRAITIGVGLLVAAIFTFAASVWAANSAENEIQQLLQFIEKTTCQYERNGELHSGAVAAGHIRKKYEYFKKKITNAESFIAYSASKSESTGKKYHVLCSGKPIQDSDQWLLAELARLRANATPK